MPDYCSENVYEVTGDEEGEDAIAAAVTAWYGNSEFYDWSWNQVIQKYKD